MEPISKFLETVKTAYITQQVEKDMKASGKSAASLRVLMKGDRLGELHGADYFYYQIFGRKSGKMPPLEKIMAWVQVRGMNYNHKIPSGLKSAAYLIARSIALNGTLIFQGKKKGLEVNEAIDVAAEQLNKDIAADTRAQIINTLTQTAKLLTK